MSSPLTIDRHFRTVLDSASDGILIEVGDRVLYLNQSYAEMLDYPSPTELTGGTIQDIAHPEDVDRLRWFGSCRAAGKPAPTRYAFRARARRGRIVTFDASISMSRVGADVLITTVVRELQPETGIERELSIPGTEKLSAREKQVLEGVLRGLRSKEIALQLDVSEKTIFTHRSRAFRKLSLRNDRDLFRIAADLHLI